MRRKRYTPEQIIKILNEGEITSNNKEICRIYGMSEQTFYNWRNKYGGMTVNEVRRLKVLEKVNQQVKRLVAVQSLDNQILKDLLQKSS